MEQSTLQTLIDKLNNEKIEGLNFQEHTAIYNALKDLALYQKIGSIEQFIVYKGIAQGVQKTLLN